MPNTYHGHGQPPQHPVVPNSHPHQHSHQTIIVPVLPGPVVITHPHSGAPALNPYHMFGAPLYHPPHPHPTNMHPHGNEYFHPNPFRNNQ